MKDSAIMPNIVRRALKLNLRNVGGEPMHNFGSLAEPPFVGINRDLRDIEHSDVLVATGKKIIDKCGLTATDIDDWRLATRCQSRDQLKRGIKMWTKPASCVRCFLRVDLFP